GGAVVTSGPALHPPEGAAANRQAWDGAARLRAEHIDDPGSVRSAMEAWFIANPDPPAAVSDVADHVDHIRAVAGIDHVGIGSDFDGTPSMPEGLGDVSCFPALFAELADRGYADEELTKIAGRNVLGVMREAEDVAARIQTERASSTATIERMDRR